MHYIKADLCPAFFIWDTQLFFFLLSLLFLHFAFENYVLQDQAGLELAVLPPQSQDSSHSDVVAAVSGVISDSSKQLSELGISQSKQRELRSPR